MFSPPIHAQIPDIITTILPTQIQQILPTIIPLIPTPTVGVNNNTINLFQTNGTNPTGGQSTTTTRTDTSGNTTRSQEIINQPQQLPVSGPRQTFVATEENSIIMRKKQGTEGYINLKSEDTELVFTPKVFEGDVTEWFVIYPQSDINVTFNFKAMLQNGQAGGEIFLPKKITIVKPLGDEKISIVLPANTTMRAKNLLNNIPWDGLFEGPTYLLPAQTCTTPEETEFALHIGRDDLQVTFTSPVAIHIPNRAEQKASYCFNKQVTQIADNCSVSHDDDCYRTEDKTLTIETNHFTQFLVAKKSINYLPFVLLALGLILLLIIIYVIKSRHHPKEKHSTTPSNNDDLDTTVHELKTPLTAIMGFANLILRGTFGPIAGTVKKPLQTIVSSGTRLTAMINDMLNFSRLQSGKLQIQLSDVPLSPLIHDVIENLSPLAIEKNITLKMQHVSDVTVLADSEKLKQILINLIGNAIKFTEKGSIHVSAKKDGEQMTILIKDTGVGISAENQEKLFKKFERGDNEGKRQGSGLGLYISRELAKKMNGDLWVEDSHVGKGTTMALSLPIGGS